MDKPKATTAAAHTLVRLIYTTLTKGKEYVDNGQAYDEQRSQSRVLHQLEQHAQKLAMTLVANDLPAGSFHASAFSLVFPFGGCRWSAIAPRVAQ